MYCVRNVLAAISHTVTAKSDPLTRFFEGGTAPPSTDMTAVPVRRCPVQPASPKLKFGDVGPHARRGTAGRRRRPAADQHRSFLGPYTECAGARE
jgi:hypothetical protein